MIRRTLLIALFVPALAFGVSACGGDDESSNDNATTTEMESTGGDIAMSETAANGDIVDVAMGTDDLSTLTDAVVAADLTGTLKGEGPFTVFAPTNDAFAALPPAELKRLLKPANKDELANILTYHVVPGEVKAADLENGQQLDTVQGGKLDVKVDGDTVTVGGARVVQADVEASNGVVHVIDTVLLPQ
jgi:uncharacterized surface protein with fasciclin (FAS1) repeats